MHQPCTVFDCFMDQNISTGNCANFYIPGEKRNAILRVTFKTSDIGVLTTLHCFIVYHKVNS